MPSNRPERPSPRRAAAAVLLVGVVVLGGAASATAQTDPAPPATTALPGATTVPPLRAPTTIAEDPLGSNCAPGEIVPRPGCGREPEEAGDPGGWLQVSLFFLTCAAVLGMVGFLWWRSRVARDERRRAGRDPVDVARRTGEGTRSSGTAQSERRSTRSDPVAETSSNRPEASAGR